MRKKISIFNLYLISFMGSFGYFLLIPVLLKMTRHGGYLNQDIGSWLYPVTLGLMPLCSVLTAPSIGRLADRYGYKRLIVAGCSLNLISFILPVIAIQSHQVYWLIFGSVLNGFAANAQPLSQAALAVMSQRKERAGRFSRDAFAMSLATILGPVLGNYLSNSDNVSWFSLTTPFYFAMLLAGITLVLTLVTFSLKRSVMVNNSVTSYAFLWRAVTDIFTLHPTIKRLVFAYFLAQLAWALFYQDISGFFHVLGADKAVPAFFTEIGLLTLLSLLVIYPRFLKRFNHRKLVLLAMGVSVCSVMLMVVKSVVMQYLFIVPVVIFYNFYYPSFLTTLSEGISVNEQGWMIAYTNALLGLAWFLSGFIVTGLHHLSVYAAHVAVVLLFALVFFIHKHHRIVYRTV